MADSTTPQQVKEAALRVAASHRWAEHALDARCDMVEALDAIRELCEAAAGFLNGDR
jgi:hypothetical protein